MCEKVHQAGGQLPPQQSGHRLGRRPSVARSPSQQRCSDLHFVITRFTCVPSQVGDKRGEKREAQEENEDHQNKRNIPVDVSRDPTRKYLTTDDEYKWQLIGQKDVRMPLRDLEL